MGRINIYSFISEYIAKCALVLCDEDDLYYCILYNRNISEIVNAKAFIRRIFEIRMGMYGIEAFL